MCLGLVPRRLFSGERLGEGSAKLSRRHVFAARASGTSPKLSCASLTPAAASSLFFTDGKSETCVRFRVTCLFLFFAFLPTPLRAPSISRRPTSHTPQLATPPRDREPRPRSSPRSRASPRPAPRARNPPRSESSAV